MAKKSDLKWDIEKDFGFDLIHLQCDLDSFQKERVIKEKEEKPKSKFFRQTRSIFKLNNCIPTLIGDTTIDKDKRVHIDNLEMVILENEEQELKYDDPKLDFKTKKDILNARLDTIDNNLKTETDPKLIDEYNADKIQVQDRLKKLEKLETEDIAKRLLKPT